MPATLQKPLLQHPVPAGQRAKVFRARAMAPALSQATGLRGQGGKEGPAERAGRGQRREPLGKDHGCVKSLWGRLAKFNGFRPHEQQEKCGPGISPQRFPLSFSVGIWSCRHIPSMNNIHSSRRPVGLHWGTGWPCTMRALPPVPPP